jgi:hypothetical protein
MDDLVALEPCFGCDDRLAVPDTLLCIRCDVELTDTFGLGDE